MNPARVRQPRRPWRILLLSAGEKPGFSRIASVLFDFGEGHSARANRRFDLALQLAEAADGLRGAFLYDPEVFEETAIQRLCGHFRVLLEALAATPDERVSALPLATPAERHRILFEWNDTARERSTESNVARLFEKQAEHTPDAIAVFLGDDRLDLSGARPAVPTVSRTAFRLGVGPGVLAGICAERSIDAAVAVLAVLKSGGAYVALDPEYPRERLEFMLEDSRAPVVLTDERSAARIPTHRGRTVILGTDSARALLAGHGRNSAIESVDRRTWRM